MFSSQVRQRVRGLVAGVGPSIISNPDQLEAKLADLAAASPEEVQAIVAAARGGVAEEIAAAAPEHRAEMVEQAAAWMASETGLPADLSRWAVETWNDALQGVQFAPPAAQAPPQAAPAGTPQGAWTQPTPPPAGGAPPAPWDTPRAPQSAPGAPWGVPPPQGGYGTPPPGPWQGQPYGAPPPGAWPPPASNPGNQLPGAPGQPRYYTQTVNAGQILAMGIIAFFCFGLILGPMAWIQGNNALGQIDDGYADPSQRGKVLAGRNCGIVATILAAIYLVTYFVNLATSFHSR